MVDTKTKDNVNTSTGSTEVTNLCDTATQNCIRILYELTKARPQYTQSVSHLQLDYVASAKNTIQNILPPPPSRSSPHSIVLYSIVSRADLATSSSSY